MALTPEQREAVIDMIPQGQGGATILNNTPGIDLMLSRAGINANDYGEAKSLLREVVNTGGKDSFRSKKPKPSVEKPVVEEPEKKDGGKTKPVPAEDTSNWNMGQKPGQADIGGGVFGSRNNTFDAMQRSLMLQQHLLKDIGGVGKKDKSEEMQRSEHFTRLADRLNNRTYFNPGQGTWTTQGQEGHESAGSYKMQPIQTEDMRAQEANRQLQVGAAEAARGISVDEQMNHNRYQAIRRLNDEAIQNMLRTNEGQLFAQFRELDTGLMAKKMIQAAHAENTIGLERVEAMLRAINPKQGNSYLMAALMGGIWNQDMPNVIGMLSSEGLKHLATGQYGKALSELESIFRNQGITFGRQWR